MLCTLTKWKCTAMEYGLLLKALQYTYSFSLQLVFASLLPFLPLVHNMNNCYFKKVLKVFLEVVMILLLFYVLLLSPEACGSEPAPPTLEGKVLTTGPPRNSIKTFETCYSHSGHDNKIYFLVKKIKKTS